MMGKPAARMGDTANTCDDPTDMPVGKIVSTTATVLINNLPAAKQMDKVVGVDTHIVMVPSPGGPVPTPLPHPFAGQLDTALSSSVKIEGMPAATVDSIASNMPPHIPTPPGTAFQKPPTNKAKIILGSMNVMIGDGGGGGGSGSGGGEDTASSTAQEAAVEEGHKLHVKFVDKGGKPITGVKFTLKDPDGEVSDGILAGEVRRGGVKEGSHEISLKAVSAAKWSKEKAKVRETVEMSAKVFGIDSGAKAEFQIFKKSFSTADQQIDTVETSSGADGVEAEWTFRYRDDSGSPTLGGKRIEKYAFPLFYFIVEIEGLRARSGLLQITDQLKIVLKDDHGDPIAGEEYVVYFANGEVRRGTLDDNGEAVEERIPTEKSRVEFPNNAGAKKLPR